MSLKMGQLCRADGDPGMSTHVIQRHGHEEKKGKAAFQALSCLR